MRKNYIDNLRWLCILLLFPYHTAMIYNDWGENFYIRGHAVKIFSAFIIVTWPWFMPLLFVLAGMSTYYALQKRTIKKYIEERYYKLLVPLFFGILLLVPIQTFFAERFHNGYTGNYFQQYALFFTKSTDLTGYTGGFTVGHLWFILYLFIISLFALPILYWYEKSSKKLNDIHFTIIKLLPLFIVPFVMSALLNIGGKSLGKYFALFLLGYLIFSQDQVMERLENRRWLLFVATVLLLIAKLIIFYGFGYTSGFFVDGYDNLYMWVGILMFLGIGKRYFDYRNRATSYLAKASFPIYVIHQSCIVATGFYVFHFTSQPAVQFSLIMAISAGETFLLYEIFKRFRIFRFMFAIKK
jgi:glucans biosynthesis protein C